MDFCACICTLAKTSVLLGPHRRLAGCNLDSDVLRAAEHDLLSTTASQVISPNSNVRAEEDMRTAARSFKERDGGFSWQKSHCRGGSTRAERDASDDRAYFAALLYALRKTRVLREVSPHSPGHRVFLLGKKSSYSAYLRVLLDRGGCKTTASVRKKTIKHRKAENGVFASQDSGNEGVVAS